MKHVLFIAICLLSLLTVAQQATQTVRGTIRDEVAQSPIIGASVLVMHPKENLRWVRPQMSTGRSALRAYPWGGRRSALRQLDMSNSSSLTLL